MKLSKVVILGLVAFAAAFADARLSPETALAQFRERFTALFTKPSLSDSACVFKTDKKTYDFNKVSHEVYKGTDAKNPNFSYTAQFCSVAEESQCREDSGSICQYDKGKYNAYLGSFIDSPAPSFSLIDSAKPEAGVKVFFENSSCKLGQMRETTLLVTCGSAEDFIVTEGTGGNICHYTIEMKSKAACLHDSGDGGISGGTVFLIILLVSVFLYVAIGCAVCIKKYERRGLDACPHKDFWAAIPGLVKDGCSFTVGKLKGLCGSKTITTSSGEYESA